ncbi:MAG TPA: hypothetical protein PKD15_03365 [Candidatus Saccharibacteria bacterium]|jgi:hypothetical protein|nr:hypothetical protein [Candidatus Saccharibacteria bacterium]
MEHTYWIKQGSDAAYPDIIWSRPESRATAGKLLIIGGNQHAFSAPAQAFNESLEAGIGVVNVLMPDVLRKTVGVFLPEAEFAPHTPSGSFARESLEPMLRLAQWSDAVLLAGDMGRNSETAMLLESFVQKYSGLLTITQDVADYFRELPLMVVDRPQTLLVLTVEQLQKYFIYTPTITPITYSMSTIQLIEALHDYTLAHTATIMVKHNDLIFVAHQGQVSTTRQEDKLWRIKYASRASVYWLQNQHKPFEAITASLLELVL